jgi:hypothetical protein
MGRAQVKVYRSEGLYTLEAVHGPFGHACTRVRQKPMTTGQVQTNSHDYTVPRNLPRSRFLPPLATNGLRYVIFFPLLKYYN